MAHSNYTVTTHTSTETTGDSVFSGTMPSTVTLVITPDAGYVASASNFSIGDPLPTEVVSVVFSDTTTAGQPGNSVNALVTLSGALTMPASDLTLLIDIDGSVQERINTRPDVTVCLTEHVVDESFSLSDLSVNNKGGVSNFQTAHWPASITEAGTGTGAPVSPGGSFSGVRVTDGHFLDTTQGTGITATVTADVAKTNPMNSLPGRAGTHTDQAVKTQHQGSVAPNTTVTLFEKTFYTGPEQAFEVTPYFEMNTAALNSGYYTVEQTSDQFTLTKTITATATNTHVIECDTTDILPGMQLLTAANDTALHTTISCAGAPGAIDPNTGAMTSTPICYPYFAADIRVASVDHTNGKVILTESNSWTNGDIVTFSSYAQQTDMTNFTSAPQVIAKKFTVKYNAPSDVACSDGHNIDFQGFSSLTDTNLLTQPKITDVDFDNSNISPNGETRKITVTTSGGYLTKFNIIAYDTTGKTYDFENQIFDSTGDNLLTAQTTGTTGFYQNCIKFPPGGSVDNSYSVEVRPYPGFSNSDVDLTPTFADGVISEYRNILSFSNRQVKVTSDAGGSGVTINSSLTDITVVEAEGGKDISEEEGRVNVSGTITKGGNILYTDAQVISGFSGEDSNSMTSDIRATLTGSGTATITSSVSGTVTTSPTSNTTVTVDYGNHISQTPNNYDIEFNVSKSKLVANGLMVLRVSRVMPSLITDPVTQKPSDVSNDGGQDFDATFVAGETLPATHKDFEVVSAGDLVFGTLGSNATNYNDNFFFGHAGGTQASSTEVDQIVYKLIDVTEFDQEAVAGETVETFTFKNNDGTTDSATKTVTINFTR